MEIKFERKKIISKIIFNIKVVINNLNNIMFGIISSDKNGNWFSVEIPGTKDIRQYDGIYTFIIDAGEKEIKNIRF